jgi:hypothetical protein
LTVFGAGSILARDTEESAKWGWDQDVFPNVVERKLDWQGKEVCTDRVGSYRFAVKLYQTLCDLPLGEAEPAGGTLGLLWGFPKIRIEGRAR